MVGRIINLAAVMLSLALITATAQAQLKCELTSDPSEVRVIIDDVRHFLDAMEKLSAGTDSAAIIQAEYLDKASPGFKAYLGETNLDAQRFVEAIRQRPAGYAALRDLPKQLAKQENKCREGLAGLKKIIPDAVFMPSYIFIGTRKGSNSQPSEYGLMTAIGEMDEDIQNLYVILVHETVHVQNALKVGMEEYQAALGGPKACLLSLSLREGVAYYFTLRSTGVHTHKKAYDYYLKNEKALWERFSQDMNKRALNGWMFEKPEDPDQPVDLGYVIGARIVEAYYDKAQDKAQAAEEILSIIDFQDFLKKSGYAEKFMDR